MQDPSRDSATSVLRQPLSPPRVKFVYCKRREHVRQPRVPVPPARPVPIPLGRHASRFTPGLRQRARSVCNMSSESLLFSKPGCKCLRRTTRWLRCSPCIFRFVRLTGGAEEFASAKCPTATFSRCISPYQHPPTGVSLVTTGAQKPPVSVPKQPGQEGPGRHLPSFEVTLPSTRGTGGFFTNRTWFDPEESTGSTCCPTCCHTCCHLSQDG